MCFYTSIDYFNYSFFSFAKQTYQPKFYVIIQNDNRKQLNLSLIANKINQPIYHIWMQNWNSFFFLNHRFSSLFPCDFVLKYDDDQWPNDNTLQERLINNAKNKNNIIGRFGLKIDKSVCGYSARIIKLNTSNVVDHCAVPLLIRPGYLKLDAS